MRPRSITRRIARASAGLLLLVGVVVGGAWWWERPATPDAFYTAPMDGSVRPGLLIRSEPFTGPIPAGAKAWRLLYATTRIDGSPVLSGALLLVSEKPHEGPRPLVVWAHATTGVALGCAPSLLEHPLQGVPGLDAALAQGWAVIATDYAGLGTTSVHPYLTGNGEARSTLDAIWAAQQFGQVSLDGQTVVWGHSQGGNAALWAGAMAPGYSPGLRIVGVAAVAPATNLPALVDAAQHSVVGKSMSSYILHAYAGTYPDVRKQDYLRGLRRLIASDMAGRCFAGKETPFSAAEAALIPGPLFHAPPNSGALGRRLAENSPRHPIAAPLLIAQGTADELVLPATQRQFIEQRCQSGQPIEFREYPGRDHLSVVADDSPFAADLVEWTKQRFAGRTPVNSCRSNTTAEP